MKAITLWQPWASLIAAGAKTIETRTWSPPHSLIGQPLAIHAAMTLVEPTYFPELVAAAVARALGDHWQRSIPTGAVLAVVTLAAAEQVDSKASNARPTTRRRATPTKTTRTSSAITRPAAGCGSYI